MGNKTKQNNHFKDTPTTSYNIHQTNEYKTGFVPVSDVGIAGGPGVFQVTSKRFPQPRTQKFRGVKVKKNSAFRVTDLLVLVESFFFFSFAFSR